MNIIVTGGGRGLGAAVAHRAAREGAVVTVVDVVAERAEAVAVELRAAGATAYGAGVDVTDEDAVRALVDQVVARDGALHGVVNAAATITASPLEEMSSEVWARVMDVNVRGTFHTCKWAVRHFLDRGEGGVLVNIGSISGVAGLAGQTAYCASKGAVLAMTRQIAGDYARHGIRCNAVSPGSMEGEFLDSYLDDQPDPAAARDAITGAHPIGRIASAEEVASAVWFLLSDDATFLAGANIAVDGGYTAV